jgi:uncharacterized protein (TIGR02271 family)
MYWKELHTMNRTVVALYDDLSTAQHVVSNLVDAGISRDSISLVANDASNEYSKHLSGGHHTRAHGEDAVSAGEGAGFGALVGAVTGVLAGLGAMAIPGIGPVVAAGPIIAGLTGGTVGAVAGAATGGIVGGLVKTGVPEEEAGMYAEGVRRGGTLVVVHTDENLASQANAIMNRHNPVDIDERSSTWQNEGWTGFNETSEPLSGSQIQSTSYRSTESAKPMTEVRANENETVLPVVEEELQVGKREVERGGVRIFTRVEETPVEEQVTLREERVNIERRPVDRPIDTQDIAAFQDQSIELRERGEEVIVNKTARVVEEVVVNKEVEQHTETVRDTVRRTDVEVERTGDTITTGTTATSGSIMSDDFTTYDSDFQTHYTSNFANSGYTYDQYMPVYRYGYNLGSDQRYSNMQWSDIEPDARRAWEERNPNTWEQFKDSIKYGFERFRNRMSGR